MDSLTSRRSTASGIALLEALLAMALFGLAAVALVGALRNMGAVTADSARESYALGQMRTLMEESLRSPVTTPGVTTTGPDERGLTYQVEVSNDTTRINRFGNALPGLYRIVVTASWKEGTQVQTLQAETLKNAQLLP